MIARLVFLVSVFIASSLAGTFSTGETARLGNGLEVVLIKDASLPVVATGVLVNAGARNEEEATSGATHLLEHMLFNGTETMSQDSLYTAMELHGLYINAATRNRGTVFLGLASPQELKTLLSIQSEMLFSSSLSVENFEKEKKIVLEELANDRTRPEEYLQTLHASLIYSGTPARFPILGSPATVEAMPRDLLFRYYKNYYVPNNMTLLLMGNFQWPEVWDLVRDSFGAHEAGPIPTSTESTLPDIESIPTKTISMPVPSPSITLTYAAPGSNSSDFAAFYMATELLPDLVEEMHDSTIGGLDAYLDIEENESRLVLTIDLGAAEDVQMALAGIDSLLSGIADLMLSEDQLEMGRRGLKVETLRWIERPHMFPIMAYDVLTTLGWAGAVRLEEQIDNLESRHVSEVFAQWIVGTPKAVLVALPGKEKQSFNDLDPKPGGPTTLGMVSVGEPPSYKEILPAILAVTESVETTGFSTFSDTLDSGMVLCVREESGLELSALHVLFRRRADLEAQGKEGSAEILHRLLESGPSDMGVDPFKRSMRRLGAQIQVTDNPYLPFDDYYYSSRWGYIRLTSPSDSFLSAARLLAATLQEPKFDPDIVSREKLSITRLLKREGASPRKVANKIFWTNLVPGDARSRSPLGTVSSVDSVTVADLAVFSESYLNAANIILTVSVPREGPSCLDSLSSIFGVMPGNGSPGAGPSTRASITGPWVAEDSLGMGQGYIIAGLCLSLAEDERQSLEILSSILSRRMGRSLREEKGLAYSLGASARFEGKQGLIRASMGTRPDKMPEAQAGLKRLIAALVTSPVHDRIELRASAKRLQQRLQLRRLTRIGRTMAMGLRLLRGEKPMESVDQAAGYLSVTSQDLLRLASRLDRNRVGWVLVR